MMEIRTAEPETAMIGKDELIEALAYCIEMPDGTELEYAQKRAYEQCLANLGIIRQKNS